MLKIISSFGAKGGTGKSTILFAILKTLQIHSGNILVINCDNSSVTIPFLIEMSKTSINYFNITEYYFWEFYNDNINFFKKFDYLLIDLKGEELRTSDLITFFNHVDYFIMPFIPSYAGLSSFVGVVDKCDKLGCDTKKIHMLYNLLGYSEKSNTLIKIQEAVGEEIGNKINIFPESVSMVSNIEDKSNGILSSKKNKLIIQNLLDALKQ